MNFFGTIWPRRLIRLKDILESGDLLFTCGLDDKKKQFFKQDLAAVHGFRKGLNSKNKCRIRTENVFPKNKNIHQESNAL